MDRAPVRPALNRPGCRGAAVVVAMLLAALAASVAVALVFQQRLSLTLHEQRREQVQGASLTMAAIQWARQILDEDGRAGGIDHTGEAWAFRLPPTPIEDGVITGYIVDQQGLFNLNGTVAGGRVEAVQRGVLARLLAAAGIPAAAADAVVDWIDADATTTGEGGAEDAFYIGQPAPRLAGNQPIVRPAELVAIRGLGVPGIAALAGLVTALPAPTRVNVNTAPPAVLTALLPTLDPAAIDRIVGERASRPFTSIDDLAARLPGRDISASRTLLGVSSDYFLVTVEARQGTTTTRARALLHRAPRTASRVVWQVTE